MLLRCLLLLLAGSAGATPQITWLQTDWPPHQIVSGPFQGQGTFDLLRQQLIAAMPEFTHSTRLVSLARLEQIFQQKTPGFCAVGTLYSEERSQNRLYSTPMAVGPAISIGFVQQNLLEHAAIRDGEVDINQLALDSKLRGAYQPSRYYAPVIAQALQNPAGNLSRHAFTSELNAAALLANGRVDYVLEYPERMGYYNQLLSQPVKLQHLMISDATDASVSYVTCTPGGDGAQMEVFATQDYLKGTFKELRHAFYSGEWQGDKDSWHYDISDDVWQKISNDRHGCLAAKCQHFRECPYFLARLELEEADVIIANHDLVLSDLSLGGGVLLPPPSETIYVIDEAHHLFTSRCGLGTAEVQTVVADYGYRVAIHTS